MMADSLYHSSLKYPFSFQFVAVSKCIYAAFSHTYKRKESLMMKTYIRSKKIKQPFYLYSHTSPLTTFTVIYFFQ